MQILGLVSMYFNAAVEFVTSHSLLFRLALAILWNSNQHYVPHDLRFTLLYMMMIFLVNN